MIMNPVYDIRYIELFGEKHPVWLGLWALRDFSKIKGKNITQILSDAESGDIAVMIELAVHAVKWGHRVTKTELTLTDDEIGVAFGFDIELMQSAFLDFLSIGSDQKTHKTTMTPPPPSPSILTASTPHGSHQGTDVQTSGDWISSRFPEFLNTPPDDAPTKSQGQADPLTSLDS